MKAILLDLDNTLHKGVLGEDGIQGVQLTLGHVNLQRYLKTLRHQGIFLALVSRNEKSDVEALFHERTDYPLQWKDFSDFKVSWGSKTTAIEQIAKTLRISPDAILMVDDNPGDLADVAMKLPGVETVFAHPDANLTRQVLSFRPGLARWKSVQEDAGRIQDIRAIVEREKLAQSGPDQVDYFRSLKIDLLYRNNPRDQLTRIADLCRKSNQFNLALLRLNEAELDRRMVQGNANVVSIELKDRFSDSGVIATVIAQRIDDRLVVEELCISCRAIGRQLENTIILLALRNMPLYTDCREIRFVVQHGPRNRPALQWLSNLLKQAKIPSQGEHSLCREAFDNFSPPRGVKWKIE